MVAAVVCAAIAAGVIDLVTTVAPVSVLDGRM